MLNALVSIHHTLTLYQLLPFLHDRNPNVRQIALQNLLGHTPKEAPSRSIFLAGLRGGGLQGTQDNDVIRDLKILCRDHLVRFYAWLRGSF